MKNSNPKKLTILIPVYKSDSILPILVAKINSALDKSFKIYDWSILLILDYPSNESWKVITRIIKKYKNVSAIRLEKNYGQHNAIFCGLKYVDSSYVLTMDDDLQHDPMYIYPLYKEIIQGYDVVYTRFHKKEHSFFKNLGSRFNSFLLNRLIDKPKNIYPSPYKIFSKKVYTRLLDFNLNSYYIDSLIFSISNNISQIQTKHNVRYSGTGNYNLNASIKLFTNMLFNSSTKPLTFISYAGYLISFISIFLAALIIYQKLILDLMPNGWASLALLILMLFSILFFSVAIIGIYLGSIFRAIINPGNKFEIKEIILK